MLIYVDKYVDIGGSGDNYVDNHDDYQHKITSGDNDAGDNRGDDAQTVAVDDAY